MKVCGNLVSGLPRKVRVSLGSAMTLGLLNGKLDVAPTTIYLLTYRRGKCTANCGFCPQARESRGRADMLSRVSWPVFPTSQVFNEVKKAAEENSVKRVCLQALNYPDVFEHLLSLVKELCSIVRIPVSVSCQPLNRENIERLADVGVERVSIPLDAATKDLFSKVKGFSVGGPYFWGEQFELLNTAVGILGKGRVTTHLIVGLGETEKEMVEVVQKCVDMGVLPALFAFTPIPGTDLEKSPQPPVLQYRRVQLARHLIFHGFATFEDMHFDGESRLDGFGVYEETLLRLIQTGQPFLTSGCPDCNRPYYNEKPSGPIYNYPRPLMEKEVEQAARLLRIQNRRCV